MDWKTFDPDAPLDWEAIASAIPQWGAMETCIQDSVFHGEGSVALHTKMVTEQLLADPGLADLDPERRKGLVLAAIFHDVAKPATRDEHFDETLGRTRVTHHGHSAMGARDAWVQLWKAGVPLATRLQVHALVAAHQKPFHVFHEADPRIEIARVSTTGCTWRELLMLARADNRGRISPNADETDEVMQLLQMMVEDEECMDGEFPFANEIARNAVFRKNSESLFYAPVQPKGSRVIVMSAPPGSGKDTYVEQRLAGIETISLDDMREEMGVTATGNQGQVAQAAQKRAKQLLAGNVPFVWNATGTSRLMRDKIIATCLAYDAHVSIHALDCPYDVMLKRNRNREARVPEEAIDNMLLRWEPPMAGEAHELVWLDALTFEHAHPKGLASTSPSGSGARAFG